MGFGLGTAEATMARERAATMDVKCILKVCLGD